MSSVIGRKYWQNYILIGNVSSPGNAIVAGATAPRDIDVRKAYGESGATLVYTGDGLAKFTVVLQMWTEAHLRDWDAFKAKLVKPPKGVQATALAIGHPLLAEIGIAAVMLEERGQLTPSPSGLWTVELKFIQWGKPAKALGRPNGSIPNAADNEPQPQDVLDVEIEKRRAAFNKAREATE